MKRKNQVLYFYAPWDRFFVSKKNAVIDECKRVGVSVIAIDVETKEGVKKSIKYGVKNVPTAVIVDKDDYDNVKAIEKGNFIHEVIAKYR